jgi:hypothetical protein
MRSPLFNRTVNNRKISAVNASKSFERESRSVLDQCETTFDSAHPVPHVSQLSGKVEEPLHLQSFDEYLKKQDI